MKTTASSSAPMTSAARGWLRSSSSLLLTRSFFFLYPLSLLAQVCWGWPPGGGGAWDCARATGAGAFIAKARPWHGASGWGWPRGARRAVIASRLGLRGRDAAAGALAKPISRSLVNKAGDREATRSRLGHGHGRRARQRSCTVRDPVGQPVPAWYPSNGLSRSVVRARMADRDRGGIGFFFPPRYRCSVFRRQRRGPRRGMTRVSHPSASAGSDDGVACELAVWAARGRARPRV